MAGEKEEINFEAQDFEAQLEERVRERTAQLELENARLAAIVAASSNITWTRDAEGGFVSPQLSWSAFTGQSFEELRGQGWLNAIHPDERERVRSEWRQGFKNGVAYRIEYLLRRRDGAYRHMEVHGVPVYLADGTIHEWAGTKTDITEKKAVEAELRRSESRFRRLVESNLVGNIIFDLDGQIMDANDAFLQMTGYTREDLEAGKIDWQAMTPPEYLASDQVAVNALIQTGRHDPIQKQYLRKDGQRVDIIVASALFEDDSRQGVGIIVDTTLLRRAQADLQESREQFENLANTISQLAWMADETGFIFWYNQRWYDYTGTDLEAMQGWGWEKVNHPDHLPRIVKEWNRTLKSGVAWEDTFPLRSKDGEYRWFLTRVQPIKDASGRVLRWCGTNTDITEKSEIEADLRNSRARKAAILESALDCIVGIDHQNNIIEWNPAAEKTFGYSHEEALGRQLQELIIPPGLREGHNIGMERYLKTGVATVLNKRIEVPAMRRGGEEFPVELTVTRIAGDGPPLFTAYLRDITSRKQTEQDLERARDSAETANKAKSLFLANMSHELRTPLNAILGYSEMLQEEAAQADMKEFASDLEKINSAGKHLLILINDILDLSKIEAGKMDLFVEEFDVGDVVQELAETVRPLLLKNHNQFHIELGADLGEMTADLTKVRQSLFNLLSNAAKFTHEGSVTLEARRETMNESEWIVLRVRDTGIGMSAEQLIKLFRPFTQADASTTRRFGGTGLGLALTRRFCQMMGGDVAVSSTLGEGSTFSIKIPAVVSSQSALVTNENTLIVIEEDNAPGTLTALPGRRKTDALEEVLPSGNTKGCILVIDDDATQRELLRQFLSREGFSVVVTSGGEEGLEMAKRIQPLAITLDVMMPDIDGWSVLSKLKSDPELHDIPVIMLTMVDDEAQGYALGASDYLTKPVDRARLARVLKKHYCPQPPCSVLLVEDDEAMRVMIGKMLVQGNWQVVQATNGREALQSIEEKLPSLILLDLMMPEMDGFDFIAELRLHREWQNIPVIVLTAKELTEEDHLRLQGYVQKVMQKTAYSRQELLEQVHNLIATSPRVESA